MVVHIHPTGCAMNASILRGVLYITLKWWLNIMCVDLLGVMFKGKIREDNIYDLTHIPLEDTPDPSPTV